MFAFSASVLEPDISLETSPHTPGTELPDDLQRQPDPTIESELPGSPSVPPSDGGSIIVPIVAGDPPASGGISSDPVDVTLAPEEPDAIIVMPEIEVAPTSIYGTGQRDRLVGNTTHDIIRARGGQDTLLGLGGDDRLVCGGGNDRASGAAGDDWIKGGAGDDRLRGNSGDDTLLGGNGDDMLSGGAGNDYLNGGKGDNVLIGKSGSDLYGLHRRGTSHIKGFQNGLDRLELPTGIRYRDLDITAQGKHTVIELNDHTLAILTKTPASSISAADVI